jgi:drug/metabolite transporter (DMT)-like permease
MNSKTSIIYLTVVLIWSTTPLGVVWSSESVHPTMAVLLRMLIALTLGSLILFLKRIELPKNPTAYRLYIYSGMGIFTGMLFTYLSAQYLSSGLISLVFGMSPILSGLLANKILGESKFNKIKKLALTIAIIGLGIVCSDSISLNSNSWPGLVLILMAVSFFSLSGVLNKSITINIHPLATTVGGLTVTIPLFILAWYFLDGQLPIAQWQIRSMAAIVYLGVFGSLIGFVGYFYILQKLSATTVSLVTLMTPIIAVLLGVYFNNEVVTKHLISGASLVMVGLGLFLFGGKKPSSNKIKPAGEL